MSNMNFSSSLRDDIAQGDLTGVYQQHTLCVGLEPEPPKHFTPCIKYVVPLNFAHFSSKMVITIPLIKSRWRRGLLLHLTVKVLLNMQRHTKNRLPVELSLSYIWLVSAGTTLQSVKSALWWSRVFKCYQAGVLFFYADEEFISLEISLSNFLLPCFRCCFSVWISQLHIAPGDAHLLQMTHTLAFIIPVKHTFSSPHLKNLHIPSADTSFLCASPRGKTRYLWYLYPSVSCWNEFYVLHNKRLSHCSAFLFFIWSFNAVCKWGHKSLPRQYCIFEIAEKWFPCAHTSWVRVQTYALVGSGGGWGTGR